MYEKCTMAEMYSSVPFRASCIIPSSQDVLHRLKPSKFPHRANPLAATMTPSQKGLATPLYLSYNPSGIFHAPNPYASYSNPYAHHHIITPHPTSTLPLPLLTPINLLLQHNAIHTSLQQRTHQTRLPFQHPQSIKYLGCRAVRKRGEDVGKLLRISMGEGY